MPALKRTPLNRRLPVHDERLTPGVEAVLRQAAGRALVAVVAPLLLGGASANTQVSFLYPQGPIAAAERTHIFVVMLLLCIVVVPVLVVTPIFAWRYRYSNTSSRYTPRWSFSWPLEFAIWGVPMGVVTALAVWLAQDTIGLDPYAPLAAAAPPVRIQVIGYDWKWLFIYPDYRIASMGELAIPAGREVAFELTSNTVLQSFFIPALGSQIYAMPGMKTLLHLEASSPGVFRGENAQYNGEAFEKQKFAVKAMSQDDFNAWIHEAQTKGVPMTPAAYHIVQLRNSLDSTIEALGSHGAPVGVVYFSGVSPTLFSDVVQSFHTSSHSSAVEHIGTGAQTAPE